MLREGRGEPRVEHDRHVFGLFTRAEWLRVLLRDTGFEPRIEPLVHSEVPAGSVEIFVATQALSGGVTRPSLRSVAA